MAVSSRSSAWYRLLKIWSAFRRLATFEPGRAFSASEPGVLLERAYASVFRIVRNSHLMS